MPIYRVIFAVVVWLSVPWHEWVATAPAGLLYPPPGLPYLFLRPTSASAVDAANVVLAFSAALLALNIRTRTAALALVAAALILNSWAYAYGKINHDILRVAVPFFLAWSTWDSDPRASARRPESREWPLPALAMVVALAMFTAAGAKIASGWLSLDTSATHFHIVQNHVVTDRTGVLTAQALSSVPMSVWHIADIATVALELAFLPALVSPVAFRLVCAAALPFHLGVWLTMDIAFATNVLAYGAFVAWHRVPGFRSIRLSLRSASLATKAIAGTLAAGLAVLVVAWGNPVNELQLWLFGQSYTNAAVLVCGTLLAGGYLLRVAGGGDRREDQAPVLLFDGFCNLCNGWVDFLIGRDRGQGLRFGSLQSESGQQLLRTHGVRVQEDAPHTVVLVVGQRVHTESAAALRAIATLGGTYSIALAFLVIPGFLRNAIYRWVARNRYRWFGRRDTCRLPTADEKRRFLP